MLDPATKTPADVMAARLRTAVDRLPRVRLACLPTPLQFCPNLTARLGGPRIFVKRDDLTGVALGGNKVRNLEFRLAEARASGAEVLVAALEAHSNSAVQTTACAARLGLRTHLVLHRERDWPWQGNLLLDRLVGARITFVEGTLAEVESAARQVAEAERARGRNVYLMNDAPMFALGSAAAYVLSGLEVREQLAALGAGADRLYLSSSGKGQPGLELAARLTGDLGQVVGISAYPGPHRRRVAELVNAASRAFELPLSVGPDEVRNEDRYSGGAYGKVTPEGVEAIKLLGETEGLLVDPVYSAKALAGLIDHIRRGELGPDQTVVFVHTGGLPAVFAYAEEILELLPEPTW